MAAKIKQNMRLTHTFILVAYASCTGLQIPIVAQEQPGVALPVAAVNATAVLQMSAMAPQTSVPAGEPIIFRWSISNISDQAVIVEEGFMRHDYQITVKNEAGEMMKPTKFLQPDERTGGSFTTGLPISLEPGKSIAHSSIVNQLYDMTKSGKYLINVSRARRLSAHMPTDPQLVSSNIEVEVTEPKVESFPVATPLAPLVAVPAKTPNMEKFAPAPRWWQIGDSWRIAVDYNWYQDRPGATAQEVNVSRYRIRVRVTGETKVEGHDCWQLDFLPERDAPRGLVESVRLLVDKEDGMARAAFDLSEGVEKQSYEVIPLGDLRYVLHDFLGVPFKLYPTNKDQVEGKGWDDVIQVALTGKTVGQTRLIEFNTKFRGKIESTVQQTWVRGEKWWRQYEVKDAAGRQLLMARVIPKQAVERWGEVSQGLQLGVALEDEVVGPSEPIHLKISLRSAGKEAKATEPRLVNITVKNSFGLPTPLTQYGQSLVQTKSFLGDFPLTLQVGEKKTVLLNRIFDMTQQNFSISIVAPAPPAEVTEVLSAPILQVKVDGNLASRPAP